MSHSHVVSRTRRQPKIPVSVHPTSAAVSRAVAAEIANVIRAKAAAGAKAVLGLATGSTPTGVYDELVRLHREEKLSFKNVVTFNLDEYWPMPPDALQSYRRFMDEHLFDHVDIPKANIHIPDGALEQQEIPSFCDQYEQKIRDFGGIDLQILGIGRTGHVGFNEPGSSKDSRTRLITLDKVTRLDAASDFFGESNVPRKAITMGVGSILDAKHIILMAFGEGKAPIVQEAVEGEITLAVAASFLQEHPNAEFMLDTAAASELTPIKTPWLLGPLAQFGFEWDEPTTRRAVIWLSKRVDKPILKLVEEDYNENGLQELLSARGSAYEVNIETFKSLQRTINGWPGGKPGRPKFLPGVGIYESNGEDVYPKRIVVFSPHPDDDVISMGGTLIRLCEQKHEVHVAYQTSGNIAVWDDEALRHANFLEECAHAFEIDGGRVEKLVNKMRDFISNKQPAAVDIPELQMVKGLIRRTEARAAARYSGVPADNIHYMDMPFYETGRVKKKPLSEEDVRITAELLERIQPHAIYAAGDLSDPHGTHRVCLEAVERAVLQLREKHQWMRDATVWHYRGAWQEWEPHQIDMAVPLSPDEVERKRMAIFKHESQKDKALFPGSWDAREFWKRAEDRNKDTALRYDALGLPEYEAIEAFVAWDPDSADQPPAPVTKFGTRAG
ncbi:MAG: glucosamine-6-phosphate deaminase [Phycisphaerae bacterium]